MDKELYESLDRKLDRLADNQLKMVVEQIEIKNDLKQHMARTEASEIRIKFMEDHVQPLLEKIKFTKWVWSTISFLGAGVMAYLHFIK